MPAHVNTVAPLARLSLHDAAHFDIQHTQTLHRLVLLQHWNITTGSKLLELGCGQGDCTTALASGVGETGSVVAVDPADLGHAYGIFASPDVVLSTLSALKQHSKQLLLAEWSLVATQPSAQPHVLAVLAQAALECRKPTGRSVSNVRTVLAPKRLAELALAAGWKLESETLVQGGEGLLDGQWKVSVCLSPSFATEVEQQVTGDRERAAVLALRDACEASLDVVPGGQKAVRAMDIWVAKFV